MKIAMIFQSRVSITIFVLLLLATIVSLRWLDLSGMSEILEEPSGWTPQKQNSVNETCPDYFKWIHEDLRPWKETGITRKMVEGGRRTANFRLIIVGGKAYVETFFRSFQTRDLFTLWGILQLLRLYPGQVPDLELLFDCEDPPVISKSAAEPPPALFRYCSSDSTADVVFPDWTFWGWQEVNIKPWAALAVEMKAENQRLRWPDRQPYAFWKGNQRVDKAREDLFRCNVTDTQDWKARLYPQDWEAESRSGFKNSDLAGQCKYQYKIYIDGRSWSVSRKYILGCDSPVLAVIPLYYDFFSRGLEPLKHYWPIRAEEKCSAIKFAVDWGAHHQNKAQEMGEMGSEFVFEQVKMEYVYDYMLHLLKGYARLLRFQPVVPAKAVELSREALISRAETRGKRYMEMTEIRVPAGGFPCSLPEPMKEEEKEKLIADRNNATRQVEVWEKQGVGT